MPDIDVPDPREWLQVLQEALATLPFWLIVFACAIIACKLVIIPAIKAAKGKRGGGL